MSRFRYVFHSLRTQHHLTQSQMAEKLGVSRSTIGMYEQGNREPDFEMMERIADYFNVDMDTLYGNETPSAGDNYQLVAIPDHLTAEEMALIHAYRALNDDDKQFVLTTIQRLQK